MQIEALRRRYHRDICTNILGLRTNNGLTYFSNADRGNVASRAIAEAMAQQIGGPFCERLPSSQGSGAKFAEYTLNFVRDAFALIEHLRPGPWVFSATQGALAIAAFDQYEHLSRLATLARENPDVRQILGGDYLIAPDIMVEKKPVPDSEINRGSPPDTPVLSANHTAELTPFRLSNAPHSTLHASISCKWTIRSDRAQNTRTEALNLIRNRKGRTPHVVVVTAEPLPRRIASIAIGTGDVDCTYHAALPELRAAIESLANGTLGGELLEEIDDMVASRRLRDISDLPFDLAI